MPTSKYKYCCNFTIESFHFSKSWIWHPSVLQESIQRVGVIRQYGYHWVEWHFIGHISAKISMVIFSDTNECVPDPCENGGQCVNGLGQYLCDCPTQYTGIDCERSKYQYNIIVMLYILYSFVYKIMYYSIFSIFT